MEIRSVLQQSGIQSINPWEELGKFDKERQVMMLLELYATGFRFVHTDEDHLSPKTKSSIQTLVHLCKESRSKYLHTEEAQRILEQLSVLVGDN
jgi:hypothetical protein